MNAKYRSPITMVIVENNDDVANRQKCTALNHDESHYSLLKEAQKDKVL